MDPDKDAIDSKPDPLFAIEETGFEERCVGDITCVGSDGENQPYYCNKAKYYFQEIHKVTKGVAKKKEFKKTEELNLTKKAIENFFFMRISSDA